jgi:hypothetical protein
VPALDGEVAGLAQLLLRFGIRGEHFQADGHSEFRRLRMRGQANTRRGGNALVVSGHTVVHSFDTGSYLLLCASHEIPPPGGKMADKPNDGLRKLQQAEDAKKARAEYEAAAKAQDANTARLRALRLEREAAAPPVKKAGAAPKRQGAKAAKTPTGTLSQWLQDQKGSGRNS